MTKAESSKAPPKLETITLRAYIHCEGCRRKIRRIIRIVDGVDDVVVDSATGKVTVTGSGIDLKTILERLQKHGKRAEVWPSGNATPALGTPKSGGGNQPKPAKSNDSTHDNTPKKKNNAGGGESGAGKPAGGASSSGNESKKGGVEKEEAPPPDRKGEEGEATAGAAASEKKAEKTKEPEAVSTEASDNASAVQQGGGNGGNGGGGGGKKGKKGGNGGGNNGSDSGGSSSLPEPLPPHIVLDRPIANIPMTTPNVTVSANRGPSSYDYVQTGYAEYNSTDYATHMFSDENANNCSIM